MLFFDVEFCTFKGCGNWRDSNKCAKHTMYILTQIKYVANIHDSVTCQVRKQVDVYRLNRMIEE